MVAKQLRYQLSHLSSFLKDLANDPFLPTLVVRAELVIREMQPRSRAWQQWYVNFFLVAEMKYHDQEYSQ